jgi:transcription antitermination factor NusG
MMPLFPGYLFLVTDCIEKISTELRNLSRYIRILGISGTFIPLDQHEVETFKRLTDQNYNVSLSMGFIIVTEGPLAEQGGLIKRIDRRKRIDVVKMPSLGKSTDIRLPLEIVNKIPL